VFPFKKKKKLKKKKRGKHETFTPQKKKKKKRKKIKKKKGAVLKINFSFFQPFFRGCVVVFFCFQAPVFTKF
jgi:hypothetical protein